MKVALLLTFAVMTAGPGGAAADDAGVEGAPTSPDPALEDPAVSLSVGTGAGGFFEFTEAFDGISMAMYEQEHRDRLQVNVRIDRELGREFRVGLAYTHLRWTEAYASAGQPVGTIDNSTHTLLADMTYLWVRARSVELYSALGAGYARWSEEGTVDGTRHDDAQGGFAFQIRVFGVSAGSERVRVFAELGLGFEGLVVGGLTLRI